MASKVAPSNRILAQKYVSQKHIPNVTAFTLHYSKTYHYSASLTQELDDARHNSPTRALYERRWNARTEPLWWTAMTPMSVEHKRTIRSWCARRLRLAFVECLEKQGYDKEGNRILGKESDAPLIGTVQLFARPPILTTKMPELTRQMEMAVQRIILENQKKGAQPSKWGEGKSKEGSGNWKFSQRRETYNLS